MNELSEQQIKQEKKNKAIGITIGLILVLVVSIGASYAYWTLTATQDDTNSINTACLKLTMDFTGDEITLDSAYPVSDFDGMQTEGYVFTVTNNCDNAIDYRIDLDSLVLTDETLRLDNSKVKVLLDYGSNFIENNEIPTYAEMESGETTDSTVKDKKILAYDTVLGNSTNTHTIRIWVDEDVTLEDENKKFNSKVSIAAGQGIEKEYTDGSCFTFDSSTGTITGYDVDTCGTDAVIPYEIDGVKVTQISKKNAGQLDGAFENLGITSVEIPRTVTLIGERAFNNNDDLKRVILKDGIITLAYESFSQDCSEGYTGQLHNLIIPSTVTTIGFASFSAWGIERLVIPDNVTDLSASAFFANRIKELKIGNGIDSISNSLFKYNMIEKLVISDNITSIENDAFLDNTLNSIDFGAGVTKLGSYVFWDPWGRRSDYKTKSLPSVINVPANVVELRDSFYRIPSTTKIVFDNCIDDITFSGDYETKEYAASQSNYIFKTDGCSAE